MPEVEPLLPYAISLILFPLDNARIFSMIRSPDHLISTRLSLPAHTDLIVTFTFPGAVGRKHGSLLIDIALYLLDAARNPENHSGSYPSITGFIVGTYIVIRASAGVAGVATPLQSVSISVHWSPLS